jgi:hypothetical protein
MDTLYVLDEPTIGLHPRDNDRLISLLEKLRDAGNTVLVVEHDPAVIRAPTTSWSWGRVRREGRRAGLRGDRGRAAPGEAATTVRPPTSEASRRTLTRALSTATARYLSGELEPPASRANARWTAPGSGSRAPRSTTWRTWTWRSR